MIGAAATESNDMIDLHMGIDVAALCADFARSHASNILAGKFPNGFLARSAVYPPSARDILGSLRICHLPFRKVDVNFLWIVPAPLFRAFSGLLSPDFWVRRLARFNSALTAPALLIRAVSLRIFFSPAFSSGAGGEFACNVHEHNIVVGCVLANRGAANGRA